MISEGNTSDSEVTQSILIKLLLSSIYPMTQMPPLLNSTENDRPYNQGYHDFHYDSATQQEPQDQMAPESASIDRDNELLSFQPPTFDYTLLDTNLQRIIAPTLNARLHGMFFIADPPHATGLFPQMAPPELTCYRRNLFQVTGSITVPRNLRYILTDRAERVPIIAHELVISATESVEGSMVKLISVPWKTPINSPPPEDKTEKEPAVIPLDLMSHHDPDMQFVTYPFAWKRLQFRIATANNGRRKELQQHFVAHMQLVATLLSGQRIPIADAKSAAIVVRGRSPRNFQKRQDLPVGDKATGRKGSLPTNIGRRTGSDPPRPTASLKRERSSDTLLSSFDLSSAQDGNSYSNWTGHNGGSNSAPAYATPTFVTPTLPSSKSPASASPPPKTQHTPHIKDEPDTKRARQGPSKSPRLSNSSQPSPQQPYKYSSLPPTLPSSRQSSFTHSPPATVPETTTTTSSSSADPAYYSSYFATPATQPWQPPFTSASLNSMYSAPYLPPHSMTASPMGLAHAPGILPNALTK